tara:strand:- start:715 stop:999 length:285 start_codon:yes stop_codon:yes gene_type:complete
MKDLRKEREVLVGATFYVDNVDPNAEGLPDLLRDKFEQEVDKNKIFFSICIPGDNNQINLEKLAEENNDLRYQVKFWQELYLKAISQQGKKDED